MLSFFAMILIAFGAFSSVFFFFYKFKASLPYYRIDKSYCRFLLQHAIKGDLPCVDWYLFIGELNLLSKELEQLRLACFDIDEQYVRESVVQNAKACMRFSRQGESELSALLEKLSH